ncbi:ABC-type glycerol-3-phosphate transport system, substrate-binding protein [Paenibacillus polysaccharolyticus]|uniref:ABC-type glycerol-3-phosphate transport system, substrate-binding protein n=1 Tax=Paenibacillus polysaccharolyticus TaxID=582692 RepID=A0A1G5ITX7_9BACL|nr:MULTISPECIES: extracellular solute-binding protein [Paenibacillus]SCY79506.1 ABC-type glycerol-3-phosphate transport system, substrate-binding protein [Paenibacillus polysaccharolyticus]
MLKKLISNQIMFIVLFAALIMLLSACSGSNDKPAEPVATKPAETETNTTPAKEEEKEEAVPAPDLNGRVIRISHWWDATPKGDSESDELARERIKMVEEKYNVKIKYLNTEYWSTSEKLSSSVLANEPFAEIVRIPDGFIWGLMHGGFLTPLDDYLKDTRVEKDVVDSMRFGGDKVYGLESWYSPNDSGLFYNKRIFKEAGLKDPQQLMDEDNWNWNTMLDAAKKLTVDRNGDGKMDQYGLAGAHYVLSEMLIASNGGKLYDEQTGKVTFNSPEAMEALNFLHSLYTEHKVIKANGGNDWEDPAKYFGEGTIAMYPGGLWEVEGRIVDKLKDEWGYVYMPKGPKANSYFEPFGQTAAYVIPKGVKDADVIVKIWEDLQDFDNWQDNRRLSLENILPDETSIANAMNDDGKVQRLFGGRFGGLGIKEQLDSVTEKFVKGEITPSTGIAQVIAPAQAAAKKVLSGEQDKKK